MVKQTRSQLHRWEQVTTVQMGAGTAAQQGSGHGCTDGSRTQLHMQLGVGHGCTCRSRSELHRWEKDTVSQVGAGHSTVGNKSQPHMREQVTGAQVGSGLSCTGGSRSQLYRPEHITAAQAGAGLYNPNSNVKIVFFFN
jgi:hypothetical protein